MDKKAASFTNVIVLLVITVLTLAILLPKIPIFLTKRALNYASENFVNVSGLSPLLVKGILIFCLLPLYWALLEVSSFKFRLFSRTKSHKKQAKFVIVSYAGLYFLALFFLSRDSLFDIHGNPLKGYSIQEGRIQIHDIIKGTDTKTGAEINPITKDIALAYRRQEKGLYPKKIIISKVDDYAFYNSITGEPLVWYLQTTEGSIELFDNPGIHPVRRELLKPIDDNGINVLRREEAEKVNRDIRAKKKAEAQARAKYLNAYINTSLVNKPGSNEIGLLIIDEQQNEAPNIERPFIEVLKLKGDNPVQGLFKTPFIKDGMFDEISAGNFAALNDLSLANYVDLLLLGRKSSKFTPNPNMSDLITAELNLEVILISVRSGTLTRSNNFRGLGAGFTDEKAEKKAIEELKPKISAAFQGAY